MMIADSKSPVVRTSNNGGRKYFMPNRPLATPDYSSDSLCSVENDNSDRSSRNDNNNKNSVNISNGSNGRKNRQHEVHDAHTEEEEHGVIMSDHYDNNNKIENRESSNTYNYSYSYSSSVNSSKSSNIINNVDGNGENDVVVSNSVISSYQTSPLSFMSSFVRTNENSTTSTKKAVVAHTNQTPLEIGNEHQIIDATSKLTDNNQNHEVADMENYDYNHSQDNKHEYRNNSDSSNNSEINDHINMNDEEDEKQLERNINDSKNNDNKEVASNKQSNKFTNHRSEHEHEECDNLDDMENVITSLELPETENKCEFIREVFVHSGQDAPIKLHVNHPHIERQPLESQDDHMYSKHQPELEEYKHQYEEQETEEDTPPRLQNRKLSYKDKGHVEPLSPEQLIEPRHFTPMNVDKELHKNVQTNEHVKRPEQKEHRKELESTERQIYSSSGSRSKEKTNISTTYTSSVYNSESNNNNNKNDGRNGNENLKEMPSPYASSSSSVVHSESTSTESSHASSSQPLVTPVQAKELLETALSERERGNKEQTRENHNVVSSSSTSSKTSMSTSSSSSSSSTPLKVRHKKKVESITNVPDSRQVHKDQETNSNNTNENSHFTGSNDSNNSGVSYDKVSSDYKINEELKICVDAHNSSKIKEEADNISSEIPAKVNKTNSEEFLNAKHLEEHRQLEKELKELQAQKGSTPNTADNKRCTSLKEREIVSQVNIVNDINKNEKKSARSIDKNSKEEKVDDKTSVQSTKTSNSQSRIRIEPLKTNSHIVNKNMLKNVICVANDNGTDVANTNNINYKSKISENHLDSNPNNCTKEEQSEKVEHSTTHKSSKHDIAHSNINTTPVKRNSHIQVKAHTATTASRAAEQTKNATKDINTHEMSVNDKNNEHMNTKQEHKSANKAHVDHVHVERLSKLVSPEHNFTQVKPENSLREQRVNRLYELLDKPNVHHNSKRSNGKIKPTQRPQQQQQKQQHQRNQRFEREMQSKNVSRNWKSRPHAQGTAVHMMRQQKRRHDNLSEEHLPTIVTEESGRQTMSIFLEPVANDMTDSKTYYFSVRAIPESGAIQNPDNSDYFNSHHSVNTLPNLSPNRSQHMHPENPIINIVNHQDSNYLTRQTGNKGHVLSPLSRQRFRPYNIINARAIVLPPVQTNKFYRPKNNKEQNRKKRKQRRLEANKPRLRKPLGLLDIPVLEITKYGPDPYAHVLRYNGF